MKLLFLCVGVICANLHSVKGVPASENDHLVPLLKYPGAPGIYRKLCYDKLLVTPWETARFMQLPGSLEVETAVSLYRDNRKGDGLPGGYWLTLTQPSVPLFGSVAYVDVKKPVDLRTIQIRRCDAPLPESAALAVHDLWMKMLKQARSVAHPERYMSVDSTIEIFSARNSNGNVSEAQSPQVPLGPDADVNMLVRVGFMLAGYCEIKPNDRPEAAGKIEKKASDLLKRVSADGTAKTHAGKTDKPAPASSPKAAITPGGKS